MLAEYALKLVTAPSAEPITLTEAKANLRVDFATDDTLITSLIASARRSVELFLRRQLVTATWDLFLDDWPPEDIIHVPLPPLQSVTSVAYVDTAGNPQTWTASNYRVDVNWEPGRIEPAYGVAWPGIRKIVGTIAVRFVAGYGAAATVPDDIKSAIYLLLADLYEHREKQAETALSLNSTYRDLLWPRRALLVA